MIYDKKEFINMTHEQNEKYDMYKKKFSYHRGPCSVVCQLKYVNC